MNSKKQLKLQKQILKEARKKRQEELDAIDNLQNNINVGSGSNKIPLLLDNTPQNNIEKLLSDTVNGQGHIDLSLEDNKIRFLHPSLTGFKSDPETIEKEVMRIAEKKFQKIEKYAKKNSKNKSTKDAIEEHRANGRILYTYEYSDQCLMRHNKGNLRYGYARFFDPNLVQELAVGEDVDLNSLRPQTFIESFHTGRWNPSMEKKYSSWFLIESPYGYEPWHKVLNWIGGLYTACPSVEQNRKYVEKNCKFDFINFESRNMQWTHDSLQALDISCTKESLPLVKRWSYGLENRIIASHIMKATIEPRYISKDFCIKNFYQDLPPLPTVGEKEADSSFIMMLPKKVCQYIMAGIPESAIIEDNLTAGHKKLLPKKEDNAYCPDQVAILVITNKKWREVMKDSLIHQTTKGFGKTSKYDSIKKAAEQYKDHPDAYLFKPGFKMLALTDEAMYCFADYNWETGTKNIRSITETICQHCNWNGNKIDDEYLQDDFEEGHMLFNGLINIAANAIIDQNREKEVVEIESLGLPRATKDETTEKKDYKKPIKWITTEREKRKKYIYPEGHVPQKGSPKSEHIRSGHWRTVWIGRGKDKQKSRVWINEMYVQGNKEVSS